MQWIWTRRKSSPKSVHVTKRASLSSDHSSKTTLDERRSISHMSDDHQAYNNRNSIRGTTVRAPTSAVRVMRHFGCEQG